MPKNKAQKKEALQVAQDNLKNSKLAVITSYKDLSVSEIEALRAELREKGIFYKVIKKTILKLSAEEINKDLIDNIEGTMTVAYGPDEVSAAKILAKYADDNEGFEVHGGWLEEKFIEKDQVEELSKLLSKEELLAKLVGTLKSPVSGFVNVLGGNLRGLVNVLNAISDSKK